MAAERRNRTSQNTRRYRTYGSVAYQPEAQEPVRKTRPIQAPPVRREQPQRRPRRHPVVRPEVQVRMQTAVSPFAVVGLFAVLVCALLLVMSNAKLAVVNHDIVELRSTLSDLQDEGRTLQARYELEFDLEDIELQFLSDGSMVRAGAAQTVYLDLSAQDNVVYYEGADSGFSALLQKAEQFFASLLP